MARVAQGLRERWKITSRFDSGEIMNAEYFDDIWVDLDSLKAGLHYTWTEDGIEYQMVTITYEREQREGLVTLRMVVRE